MNLNELYQLPSMDYTSFCGMLFRFALNSVSLLVIVRLLYYSTTKRKEYLFTFFLTGTIIFLFCYLLASVVLQLGFALGLFAVFRIIRFRTDAISIKEMAYLSIIIGISVINALFNDPAKVIELFFTNIAIIGLIFVLERTWFLKNEHSKIILYEKIDLIKPENFPLLLEDLRIRTGINITRVEIGKIDFLHDSAQIKIYFIEPGQPAHFNKTDNDWDNDGDL